jgi:hypothetical protein
MPNNLRSLELEEISLCDFPSNSEIDPRTGRKIARATVALKKRDSQHLGREDMKRYMDEVEKRRKEADDPGTQWESPGEPSTNEQWSASVPGWKSKSKTKGTKKMKQKEIFQSVLKSATGTHRRDKIVEAVQMEARRIAKKKGISLQKAEGAVWRENPQAQAAYESAKLPDLQPERRTIKLTSAEVELHRRARQLMKTSKMSYAQCATKALEQDPSLYDKYVKEQSAGQFINVPETFGNGNDVVVKGDDEDECPGCGEDVDEDDSYCGNCGRKL